jgi:hypothetical protein
MRSHPDLKEYRRETAVYLFRRRLDMDLAWIMARERPRAGRHGEATLLRTAGIAN